MKPKNKKAGLLSIVILTFLTLTLVTATLITFNVRGKKTVEMTIANIEILYAKEELINFYTDTIIETITKENPRITSEEFQQKFKENLKLYETNGQYTINEMNQIPDQTTKIRIEDGKLTFPITITLTGQENGVYATYTYTKTFQQEIPTQTPQETQVENN